MRPTGFEPATLCLQSIRSTNCNYELIILPARLELTSLHSQYKILPVKLQEIFTQGGTWTHTPKYSILSRARLPFRHMGLFIYFIGGRRESNPRFNIHTITHYHYTTPFEDSRTRTHKNDFEDHDFTFKLYPFYFCPPGDSNPYLNG